jgi:hypothetical protein
MPPKKSTKPAARGRKLSRRVEVTTNDVKARQAEPNDDDKEMHISLIYYRQLLTVPASSVAHESRTPYSKLGFLGFLGVFADLGRAGFTGLTRVNARVHSILLESKTKKPRATPDVHRHWCPARTSVFRAGHFHIAGAILGIIQRITRRKLLQRHPRSFNTLKYRIQMARQSPLCDGRGS